jgi:hypothetical protein
MPERMPPLLQLGHKAAGYLFSNAVHEIGAKTYSAVLSHTPESARLGTVIIPAKTPLRSNSSMDEEPAMSFS